MAKKSPSETRTSRMAYGSKSLLPRSTNWTNRFQSTSYPSIGGCAVAIPHIIQAGSCLALDFDNPALCGDDNRLRTVSHTQPPQNDVDVPLHGSPGDVENLGDLLIAETFDN